MNLTVAIVWVAGCAIFIIFAFWLGLKQPKNNKNKREK